MKKSRITIKDISEKAGVSYQTVSRALRNEDTKKETVEKVRRIAAELGYRPNVAARTMVTSRSGLLAVFLPELASSFYHAILEGIEDAANRRGYNLLVYIYSNMNLEQKIDTILSYAVEGMIIFASRFSKHSLSELLRHNVPMVFVNSHDIPHNASSIAVDYAAGIESGLGHLRDLGQRSTAAKHGGCGRMPESMTTHRCKSRALTRAADNPLHRSGGDSAFGRPRTHEDVPAGGFRPPLAKICG